MPMPVMSPEARIKALREAGSGNWVAFSEDESRVVATGATYDEVVQAAENAGENEPVITRVPNDWAPRVFW
jgi:threonine dehydratase